MAHGASLVDHDTVWLVAGRLQGGNRCSRIAVFRTATVMVNVSFTNYSAISNIGALASYRTSDQPMPSTP